MDNSNNYMLFDLLVTKDFAPELLDASGKPVSNPSDAELFSFDYKGANKNYGTVVILLGKENDLQIFFGDNLGKTMEPGDKDSWYDFLAQLKKFATRNLLNFKVNNLNKLKYTMQGIAAINEGLFEGRYYGKKDVSYSDHDNKRAKLMIKHSRNIGPNEQRYKAVESLFVENSDGERFKLPFKNLLGGKMMRTHVAHGGTPYDAFGRHISDIVREMNTLGRFCAATRNKTYEEKGAAMVEAATRHFKDLKRKARQMVSNRGYGRAIEEFDPGAVRESELAADVLRDWFVEQTVDSRIEEALPVLEKIAAEETKMKETEQFENWVEQVSEGTWALPDTPEAEAELERLLSKPLPVGADGANATNAIYDLIGDDALFDDLSDLAKQDPDADARPLIVARLKDFGIEVNSKQDEDLDTDGVMMTRPSNMSSESVEETVSRLIKNAGLGI